MGSNDPPTVFDGEISVFPLPPEIPPEIPRVLLASKDKQWTLAASPARIGVSWNAQSIAQEIPNNAIETCARILSNYFVSRSDVQANRLGFVISRAAPVAEPAQQLIHRFCNQHVADPGSATAPLRHSIGFELHNLKKFVVDGFTINSWVRCKTAQYKDDKKTPTVVFEQDLNIADDSEMILTPQLILRFFEVVEIEAKKILALYFPE